MDVTELLKPRYKVIADYPKNPYAVGDIITCKFIDKEICDDLSQHKEKYPHLFKKLNWWEHRDEKDMPMYLRSDCDKKNGIFSFHKIVGWDMKNLYGIIDYETRSVCSLLAFNPEYGYFPATEKEYLDYEAEKAKEIAESDKKTMHDPKDERYWNKMKNAVGKF